MGVDLYSIRADLPNQHLCLIDLCAFLLQIVRPNDNARLDKAAEVFELPNLSQALQRKALVPKRKRVGTDNLPVIASANELVGIIWELKSYYSRAGMRGRHSTKLRVLTQRVDELVGQFPTTFPGLWVECDIQQLYTSMQPASSTDLTATDFKSSGMKQQIPRDVSEPLKVSRTFVDLPVTEHITVHPHVKNHFEHLPKL
jgi:hypothetical protein